MVTETVEHSHGHNDHIEHNDKTTNNTTNNTTNDCTKIFWVVCNGGAHDEDFKLTHHRQVTLKAHTCMNILAGLETSSDWFSTEV